MGSEAISDLSSTIATIISGLGIGIFGIHQYLKKPKDPTPHKDVSVVSATLFSDRVVLENFTRSMECLRETLQETNELLRAESIERHVAARVRAELRERGLKEKD